MKFVEQHRGDALQRRIVEDHAGEDAFRDDLDPGAGGDAGLETHAQADNPANLVLERVRHALGRGSGGEPPRLQHDDPPPGDKRLIQKDKRHAGGLARPRRGDQNRPASRGKRAQEGGDRLVDGQGFVEDHGADWQRPASAARLIDAAPRQKQGCPRSRCAAHAKGV